MDYTNPALPEEAKTALTEIEKQFIQMRSAGLPIRKIAKTLSKSTHTICKWNKKYYKNIVEITSDEFKDLRNKIVDFKSSRLDFLIDEFKNVKDAMSKSESLTKKNYYSYEGYLDLMMKLSKLIEKFESDLLIYSNKVPQIDESQIIDAENEDIEIIPEENTVAPVKIDDAPEQKTVAPEQKTVAPEQKTVAPEQKTVAPEQKTVAPEQKESSNDSSQHTDNT
jgi:hypothetical protein